MNTVLVTLDDRLQKQTLAVAYQLGVEPAELIERVVQSELESIESSVAENNRMPSVKGSVHG
jgi:hypothetical protein